MNPGTPLWACPASACFGTGGGVAIAGSSTACAYERLVWQPLRRIGDFALRALCAPVLARRRLLAAGVTESYFFKLVWGGASLAICF